MATTSIPNSRKTGSPMEKFTDAVFMRDSKPLYFGDGGDVSLQWNGSNLLLGKALESLSDVDPAVSNACFLSSDAASGAYCLAVSAG